ncbi:MAG: hypothetical protein RML40_07100 [Bacteroidota bacterium]|nr:hypothetical protein [Candidatus Kapabacteria bacterium]MDW8220283.1 hypothetical protein [Bacteroidota bacterium]
MQHIVCIMLAAAARYRVCVVLSSVMLCACLPAQAQRLDSSFFSGMKARSIGPAGMSGRVSAVVSIPEHPNVIYVGAATGGVWKSVNRGTTWQPIFDTQNTSSIGAIACFPGNPNIVWVGTGEGNVRNSAGVGRGVFKSLDAGKTWKCLGLEKTERIHRVILHPTNPDIAWVAAMGTTWGENPERGVFKTTDGGKTWRKTLFVDTKTGCADLVQDPHNPNHLIAAMWEHRRYPWFFMSGGPGSGMYTSYDGGETWIRLTTKEGLPEGHLGRIGIAFAPSAPGVVYALVEAKESVLLRSDNGGEQWRVVNSRFDVNPRPFYFCDIRVHPQHENTVYRLQVTLDVSTDGGKTFASVYPYTTIHPDHHDLWIHPQGQYMIVANDGGVAISEDDGKTWRFVDNLPLGQFYHVAVDNDYPYNVYGGLQDNGSWRGPSNSLRYDGIYNYDWITVGFGDGFATIPDPENNQCYYAMSQGGALIYGNIKTGVRKSIRPTESRLEEPEVKHRYNWNAAIALDPFKPSVVYYGSQFVHKSTNRGDSWQIISPDLTTNDPAKQKANESGGLTRDVTAAENHCTILCIAPSPVREGVIWVSTDDGNVQLTQDGGKTWSRVSASLTDGAKPRVPQGTWSPHVEASPHDAATAFVVFDDHRRSNWETYVFVTRDFGKTWQSLATADIDGFCHVIRQDPVEPNLLFVGTEFGLFVSFNGGKQWQKWTNGLPTVPVTDMVIHRRDHDLIIGTHGRGIYILDDIRPLRELARKGVQALAAKPLHMFEVGRAVSAHYEFWAGSYIGTGHAMFKGEQRPYGALISYILNPADSILAKNDTPKAQKIAIEILNPQDSSVIRTIRGTMKKGINRVAFDLRRKESERPRRSERERKEDEADAPGVKLFPGTYLVRMKADGITAIQPLEIVPDLRIAIDTVALRAAYTMSARIESMIAISAKAVKQLLDLRKTIRTVDDFAKGRLDKAQYDSLARYGKTLDGKLDSLLEQIVPNEERSGIYDRQAEIMPQIATLIGIVHSSYDAPTEAAQVKYEKIKARLSVVLSMVNALFDSDVPLYRQRVESAGITIFPKTEVLKLKE